MRVIESLHEYEFGAFAIRFWQAERGAPLNVYPNRSAPYVREFAEMYDSVAKLAEFLATLPYCNAVQVTDRTTGTTILIYPEWP